MTYYFEGGANRYVCSVLEEMRKLLKVVDTTNLVRYVSMQKMLIEEAQTLVNSMESSLEDWNDIKRMRQDKKKIKMKIKNLKQQLTTLELKTGKEIDHD